MTDNEKMREAFEKWARTECFDLAAVGGFYSDNETDAAYKAWQAAQSVPVVGEPVAWLHDDRIRVIAARTKVSAIRDGGAMESSLSGYSIPLYEKPTTSIPAAELERLRAAARALKALLARDLSYVDNIVYFPFESSTQAFNHILDARDAAIAAEGEKK